jgi:hypothetical protein
MFFAAAAVGKVAMLTCHICIPFSQLRSHNNALGGLKHMTHGDCLNGMIVKSLLCCQVCKYIDIPLQHISNMTLLGMNRPPQHHTVSLLHKLRERIPDLALRTTFIAGFPGPASF